MPRDRNQQQRIETALAVVLRTPGLFIIEYWWQNEKNNLSLSFDDGSNYISTILNNISKY